MVRRVGHARLSNIDLNLLLTLAILLQTRSVSATARRIGTSQPTVSRSLARLRDMFADPLLIRTNTGMELTRRAEDLVAPLQAWLASTDSLFASNVFDPATVARRFRIASTDFGVTSVISPALARFHAQAPHSAIDVVAFSDGMLARLTSGELDLVISGLDPDNSLIYSQRLFTMPAVCVMRAGHPLAAQTTDRISIDQFLEWPHVSVLVGENGFDKIGALLGEHARRRRIVATTPYFGVAHTMVMASDVLLVLPGPAGATLLHNDRFAIRSAPEAIPPMDYWISWHERSRRDPATMWLVDRLAECCIPQVDNDYSTLPDCLSRA